MAGGDKSRGWRGAPTSQGGVEFITCQHVSGGSKQTLASSDGMDILFWTLDQQDSEKPLGVW